MLLVRTCPEQQLRAAKINPVSSTLWTPSVRPAPLAFVIKTNSHITRLLLLARPTSFAFISLRSQQKGQPSLCNKARNQGNYSFSAGVVLFIVAVKNRPPRDQSSL
jgi:hypothetical protein